MLKSDTGCGREPLVDTIVRFLARERATDAREIRECVERAIDESGPGALDALSGRLFKGGTEWAYYQHDPLARRIHQALASRVLQPEPVVHGAHHLAKVSNKPLVIFANHLSYSDANVVEVILRNLGCNGNASCLADRLTAIAGPKVYSNLTRRFSSLCFGTIKVPQSSERSSEDAVMPPRDVARAARRAIEIAQERLALGEALLIFAEGSRSRTGQMQQFLPGTARYLERPGTWVLPIGIAGTEKLFPIDAAGLHAVPITMSIGRPIQASDLRDRFRRDRRMMMDCVGRAVADLLPPEYRGVYGLPSA
ncbi:MAG TPA: lysophospholipid acyltransferase family protein [Vicinamibacterales bacterium]|nr:lysophospholipid acyltransferase family protein [Vicinamibacterales bacterium]